MLNREQAIEIEVVDGELILEPELTLYVSGESLPGESPERRAAAPGRELVVMNGPTIEGILEAFRQWMRLDVGDGNPSPETLRAYFGDVRQHLHWLADEGLMPAQAGDEDLKGFRAWLVETYAVNTVGRKLAAVRRFYEMAHARGLIVENPAKGLKAPRNRTEQFEQVKYLPLEPVRRLLKAPRTTTPKGIRDKAILVLLAMHGLRVIEVHRLSLEDVDLERGEAGEVRVLGKGAKYRTVLLTEATREELKKWLAVRNMMHCETRALFVSMDWSRPDADPSRVSRRGIRSMVDGYLEMVGAKKEGISCHALRHSFATLALAAGGDLLAISGALGHSSVTTTQVYCKIVDRARKNPAKLLVGLLD